MEDEYLNDLIAFSVLLKNQKAKKRLIWTKNWLLKRARYGHTEMVQELRAYPEDYKSFLRMDEDTYKLLLRTVSPFIEKQNTTMRDSISTHERLMATLRFLATGESQLQLRFSSCISQPALSKIIPETCAAIFNCLQTEYMKVRLLIHNITII